MQLFLSCHGCSKVFDKQIFEFFEYVYHILKLSKHVGQRIFFWLGIYLDYADN